MPASCTCGPAAARLDDHAPDCPAYREELRRLHREAGYEPPADPRAWPWHWLARYVDELRRQARGAVVAWGLDTDQAAAEVVRRLEERERLRDALAGLRLRLERAEQGTPGRPR